MKKIIALVVAIVMMAAIAVPAFAAAPFSGGQGVGSENSTLVTYGVTESYVVVVPAAINISDTKDAEGALAGKFVGSNTLTISAGYKIPAGKSIYVTMASGRTAEAGDDEAKWYLNNAEATGTDLEYTVHIGTKDATAHARNSTAAVLTAASGVATTAQSTTIYCATVGTDLANQFTDTITFAAKVDVTAA